jgi:hypothetical protein
MNDLLKRIQSATGKRVMVLPYAEGVELQINHARPRLLPDDIRDLRADLAEWLESRGLAL